MGKNRIMVRLIGSRKIVVIPLPNQFTQDEFDSLRSQIVISKGKGTHSEEIMMKEVSQLVPIEMIQSKIMVIRGEKVMIDGDLAELYGVETKQLKRAVRRNADRFPSDFMFELTREEYNSLRSQFGTLKRGAHSKYLPMALTEQGVARLTPARVGSIFSRNLFRQDLKDILFFRASKSENKG